MITKDGAIVLDLKNGYFIKITDILYIEGGVKLFGLEKLKPIHIYLKNHDTPLAIDYMSEMRVELFAAIMRYYKKYKKSTLIATNNCYFIDFHEIIYMAYIRKQPDYNFDFAGDPPVPTIFFKNGFSVEIPEDFYIFLMGLMKQAVELESNQATKED